MTIEECVALLYRYAEYNGIGIQNLAGCKEAMKMAADLLSHPSLPSNLDEAEFKYAQSLDEIPANQEEEKMIYDAFKAGAEWCDAQVLKLPNNLDEAAERYAWIEEEPLLDGERLSFCFNPRIDAFKIGAKWMAEQGETVEGYITDEIAYNGIAVILDNEGQFKPGDKVIVQIRKKEE